jgi:hypothetical protein
MHVTEAPLEGRGDALPVAPGRWQNETERVKLVIEFSESGEEVQDVGVTYVLEFKVPLDAVTSSFLHIFNTCYPFSRTCQHA